MWLTGVPDRDARSDVATRPPRYDVAWLINPDLPEPQRLSRLFFRTGTDPRINATGRYMAVDTSNAETTLLDLAHGTQWTLPLLNATNQPLNTISPTGRTALQFVDSQVVVMHLDAPDDPRELRAWILEATNFTLDANGP